jgi:hypothetical protein
MNIRKAVLFLLKESSDWMKSVIFGPQMQCLRNILFSNSSWWFKDTVSDLPLHVTPSKAHQLGKDKNFHSG